MSASQNNLTLTLNQQDSGGVNILNRTIGAIGYAGLVGQFTDGLLSGTGATTFTLPTTNVLQFLFLNTEIVGHVGDVGQVGDVLRGNGTAEVDYLGSGRRRRSLLDAVGVSTANGTVTVRDDCGLSAATQG